MIDKQENKCPLCNGMTKLKEENFIGYKEDMIFKIYLCNDCLTSFALPRTNASRIYDFIYRNGENVPGYNRYWNYFKQIKKHENPLSFLANSEEAYWGIRKALERITGGKRDLKILEIGCGLGYLTYALRSENYDVRGLDISQDAVDNANQNFGNYFICEDLFKYVETNSNSFDIIILTEVIEHVEQPIEFIETTLRLLNTNGKVILTTPNRSLSPLDIVWDSEAPPVHYWWFGEPSMKYIANKLKLNLDFISFKEFYDKKPQAYSATRARNNSFRIPIINKNWELHSHRVPQKNGTLKSKFKSALSRFNFMKQIFKRMSLKLKVYNDPSTIICGERGNTLCVVFQKND
jgi:SAM-dependent methyltransferase